MDAISIVLGVLLGALVAVAGAYYWGRQHQREERIEPVVPVEVTTDEEPVVGNVKARDLEWRTTPSEGKRYSFPVRTSPPQTRYEDFNRKLFVYRPGPSEFGTLSLPPRALNDYPTPVTLGAESAANAAAEKLREHYPVIIDPMGWFAAASAQLEREPYFRNAVTEAYLAIPEADRPLVMSAAVGDSKADALIFVRYGFDDFRLPVSFLQPYMQQGLSYVFAAFISRREDWLWFSPARLRKHVTDHELAATLARRLEEATRASQTPRSRLIEVLSTNDFSTLWGLRDARLSQTDPPSASEASDSSPAEGPKT